MKTYEFIRTADRDELVNFILFAMHFLTDDNYLRADEPLTEDALDDLYKRFIVHDCHGIALN